MRTDQSVFIPRELYTILQYIKVATKKDIKDLVIDALVKTYSIDKLIKSSSVEELENLMIRIVENSEK